MGQTTSNIHNRMDINASTPSSTTTCGRRRSFRSPFLRRKKHKYPLSATFQAPFSNNFEALNINGATVEQFMTLPGIDRRIAQSIVDHRAAVGGIFQRVDDLALVSGIGAEKLEQIRREICIKRTPRSIQGSSVSSRTPSLESILSEPNSAAFANFPNKCRLNVNKSTVFQLQQLPGMNQELAANLIDYRNRKGPFNSLDQLIKVKGISSARVGAIRSLLSIHDDDMTIAPDEKQSPANAATQNGFGSNRHRKSISMPVKMSLEVANGFINAPVNDIFDLLGAYSHRPVLKDDFNYERNGHPAIRMASWNLDRMCLEKSSNLGVREVVCRTILENRLSILCLQEIYEQAALHAICDELNNPSLRRCIEWKDNTRNWKWLTTNDANENDICLNGLGIIYDASRCDILIDDSFEIPLGSCSSDESSNVAPSAQLVTFQFSDWKCRILNVYLRYYDMRNLQNVISAIQSTLQSHPSKLTISDIFMVAGDFTGLVRQNGETKNQLISTNENNNTTTDVTAPKNAKLNVNLESLGFYSSFEPNSTSFSRDQIFKSNSDANSSCNILCSERMPSTKSAFREALYRTKSPLSIYNHEVPFEGEKLCGYYGVIREGLCHMAIPRGWVWGGPASEHFPIWVEVYKMVDRSQAATKPQLTVRATDEMRRKTVRRNSLTSCRSLKLTPLIVNRSKLERGSTVANITSATTIVNCEGNSVFYDATDDGDTINQSNTSSNSSLNNSTTLPNGKCHK